MDILIEERENQIVQYYCLSTEDYRYDLTVIYSNLFFGKAMVISMQTGRMVLMCHDDIKNEGVWAEKLGINPIDIEECKAFLRMVLNQSHFADQY